MLTLEHLLQDRQQDAIFLPANILATGIPKESLPRDFPAPSIDAEPDGALTMEWHGSERRTLSVSVSSGEELHFAGLFGPNRVYGSEAFVAEIPQPILDLIRRVYAE